MRRHTLLPLLFLALVPFATVAGGPDNVNIPRIEYQQRKLPNGLQVLAVRDGTTPTVAIHVWYSVGSKDDPQGRSGFAHLFEHLMFKSTKHMKDEMIDRLTEDVGGTNNATTYDDFTAYFEVVPSNYLETLLWAEAERMSSLNVTEKNFPAERDVVKEEFRQNYVAPPYGMLFYMIEKRSFTQHPYRRPGIGNIDELNAASLEDVKQFHKTYYRPDNATLVVVGDFDPQKLNGWIDKYFGPISKPGSPLPRVEVKEPQRTGEKRYIEHKANVPLPAVALTYLVAPVTSDDAPALQIAEAILSQGESSRLYQSLVYSQQIAQSAFANCDLRQDAGLFVIGAILASDKKPEQAEKALLTEVNRIVEQPVNAEELTKAKNQLVTDALRGRETNEGKAWSLAWAAIMLQDPAQVNKQIERLQAVQAADVQRVMKKYFTTDNRVVIHYVDESAKTAVAGKGGAR